jgi:hypothetical protein
MLFPAFPIVYREARGWSNSIGGLAFISLAVGMMGAVIYSIFEIRRYNSLVLLERLRYLSVFSGSHGLIVPAYTGSLVLHLVYRLNLGLYS